MGESKNHCCDGGEGDGGGDGDGEGDYYNHYDDEYYQSYACYCYGGLYYGLEMFYYEG